MALDQFEVKWLSSPVGDLSEVPMQANYQDRSFSKRCNTIEYSFAESANNCSLIVPSLYCIVVSTYTRKSIVPKN